LKQLKKEEKQELLGLDSGIGCGENNMIDKKVRRANFRSLVLKRDKYSCVMCGLTPIDGDSVLDVHHICDRTLMPFGGYVPSNGITLCTNRISGIIDCHSQAEQHWGNFSHRIEGIVIPTYTPQALYDKIRSTHLNAYQRCLVDYYENQAYTKIWYDFCEVQAIEIQVCLELDCDPNEISWLLSCEKYGTSEDSIKIFGRGREYAAYGGTKRHHQEDDEEFG
jgi:hypothetical protein